MVIGKLYVGEASAAAFTVDKALVPTGTQKVRATVAVRRDHLVPVVQEALAALVDETARPVVSLHPDDVAPVAERLDALLQRRGGALVADPALSPGDCRVQTSATRVDATLARRWQRALGTIGRHEDWIE